MTTLDDLQRIADRLPNVVESEGRFGFSVLVKGKTKAICWSWMERIDPKKARVPNERVLAVVVPSLEAKELLLASHSESLFTEAHYNGYPAVLVRLDRVEPEFLEDLVTEAWRAKTAKRGR